MKQVLDSGASREAWSARYEQLRAGWLTQELRWGQALFIRQGMAAWMNAWPVAEPPHGPTYTTPTTTESDFLQRGALDSELQRQLACELANLILHHHQEVLV